LLVYLEITLNDELADHGPPWLRLQFGADAKDAEFVVMALTDLVGLFAEQDIDDMGRTEVLAGPVDGRQQLARGFGRIPGCRWIQAIVAIAAVVFEFIAEIGEQRLAPALGDLAPAEQCVELLALVADERFTGVGATIWRSRTTSCRP